MSEWNEKKLLDSINNYYDNTSKEQFINDLKKANSLQYCEDAKEENE